MFKISQLKLKGFKSFKYANLELPENFVCLAGPNGSGKSNICDSIRFVLGEQSLRSLRVKKAKDLIHAGLNSAEVFMVLGDGKDKKYEIRRAIRTDGKILYKLNGKKTTRNAILEVLKQYNLDESGRNIIAQGRIQRIVEMTGRERRGIIESVAGISDFDKKKKEALRELDNVGTRIREANIILGERSAYLSELKKEREIAIRYKENKANLKTYKGSLLKMELDRLDSEFQSVILSKSKLTEALESKEKELEEINSKIFKLDEERTKVSTKLKERQMAIEGVRNIEKLKAAIELKGNLLNDRDQNLKKLEEQKDLLEKQMKLDKNEVKKILEEIKKIESELKEFSPKELEFKVDSTSKSLEVSVESSQDELYKLRSNSSSLDSEINTNQEVVKLKKDQLEKIMEELSSQRKGSSEEDETTLKSQSSDLANEISSLFDEEKKINYDLANLDKDLLKLREKSAQLKAQSSAQGMNPALSLIKDLKDSGKISGIYGPVVDLISFDPKYTSAVEASLAGRLFYVVVKSTDIATKIIQILKKMKKGRATFIPLDRIKSISLNRKNNLLLNHVSFDPKLSQAMEFAFSDTILVEDAEEAKKPKLKDSRVVTLDGEVFEKSGLITGGKLTKSLLASSQIKKLEEEVESLRKRRSEMMQRLEDIREEGNRKRREKSEIEVKLKTIEIEQRSLRENEERINKLKSQRSELEKEIKKCESKISLCSSKKSELESSIQTLTKKMESLKQKLEEEEEKEKEKYELMSKKRSEVASKISSLKAKADGKQKELEIRKTEMRKRELELKELDNEIKSSIASINQIKRELPSLSKELAETEEKIKQSSKKTESLLNQLTELEEKIKKFGEERGSVKLKMDGFEREKHQNEIKEATTKTRLVDLKTEYEEYKDIKSVKLAKRDLTTKIKECEDILNSIEAVNLAAIELYETKEKEVEELNNKISLLSNERQAILDMIKEIEERKREIFFETFNEINKNFEKMLEAIPVGRGHLYLDKPDDPFESSLLIKIEKNKRNVSIDSLSGGESTLVAIAFIFAIQFYKPAPFYILDEVDAALDKQNSKHFVELVKQVSKNTQFLAVSHNDLVIEKANAVLGVTRVENISKIVGVKLDSVKAK